MSGIPRHVVRREEKEAGVLYDLPWHGQVCLHTEDASLLDVLQREGFAAPRRPPYLDAADRGVHGSYRPTPQINLFFEPPLEKVVEALRPTLEAAGYTIAEVAPASA